MALSGAGKWLPLAQTMLYGLRVCVVTTAGHGLGGMQRHTHDLVRGLVATGHEVDVICPRGDTPVTAYGARWLQIDADGPFTSSRWLRESADAFSKAHRERGYDVAHGEGSSGLGLILRGLHKNVPLVEMFHSVFSGLARASLMRVLVRRTPWAVAREGRYLAHLSLKHFRRGNWYCFRSCEIIVPSYQQVRDTMISHLVRRDRIHVVQNGVDSALWRPATPTQRGTPLLVAGGRLDTNKGFDIAIRALSEVDARMALTGRGRELDRLKRLAKEVGVAERISFVGPLPLDELVSLVASADVYLFPTLEYEASGLALLEAMSAGVPVVAAKQGATAEAINEPGRNGVLVPRGNAAAMARAVNALLADPHKRKEMGRAARERVLASYTLDTMIRGTAAVYETAVRHHPRGPVLTTSTIHN